MLFFALSKSVTPGEDTWLIDSGASKNMAGKKTTLSNLKEKNSSQKISLGDAINISSKILVNQATSLNLGPP